MIPLRVTLASTKKDQELQESLEEARRSITRALRGTDPSSRKIARNLKGILQMIEDTRRMKHAVEEPETPRTERRDVKRDR